LLGTVRNRPVASLNSLTRLMKPGRKIMFYYESRPCSCEIYRSLKKRDVSCTLIAPSLVPTKVGGRVKTDKRDSKKLPSLFRSGKLTAGWVHDVEKEALRDLVRVRQEAAKDQ
jgi:transposase